MRNGIPRILIIRLSAIGDVVRVLPALDSLREAFPDAQIDWAVERRAADVVSGHPALDDVLVFDRPEGVFNSLAAFWNFCGRIRRRRYEIVIDFHGIFKSGVLTRMSGAPDRYGFARPRSQEGSSLCTNRRVVLGNEVLNRIEENLRLVELLAPRRASLHVTCYVPPDVQEDVEDYFGATFDSGKLIVAMHAPVDRPEKQWPHEHFAALSDMLIADGRFEVLLTWGPGQFGEVERVLAQCRRQPQIAPETPDLKHYMWMARCADVYVGGDTGPMHIASAMGTPVVAVFGGTNPEQHAPLRRPYEVITAEQPAPGDASTAKLSGAERLRRIPPETVYDACLRVLAPTRGGVARGVKGTEGTQRTEGT